MKLNPRFSAARYIAGKAICQYETNSTFWQIVPSNNFLYPNQMGFIDPPKSFGGHHFAKNF